MFGKKDETDRLREALAATGCDMNLFRNWQKQYEKRNRQLDAVRARYEQARQCGEQAMTDAGRIEELLTGDTQTDTRAVSLLLRDLKRLQNRFDHEFLVSKGDQELHSTYEAILRFGAEAVEDPSKRLIFQSEIENLMVLLGENLEKEAVDPGKLSYFYLNHTDEELTVLPPSERLALVNRIYEEEFLRPIRQMVEDAIWQADEQREAFQGNSDRKSTRFLESIAILPEKSGADSDVQERAERVLSEVLHI